MLCRRMSQRFFEDGCNHRILLKNHTNHTQAVRQLIQELIQTVPVPKPTAAQRRWNGVQIYLAIQIRQMNILTMYVLMVDGSSVSLTKATNHC